MVPSLYAIGEDLTQLRARAKARVRLRGGGEAVAGEQQPGNA